MITIINNQPIRFRNSEEIDESCECLGHSYCQPINKNDATQFQIKASNIVSNGTFDSDLTDWNVFEAIIITLVSIINPTPDTCDGSFVVSATGGVPSYLYSIDGGTPQVGGTFINLCPGTHYVLVTDSEGNEGTLEVTIDEGIDCGDFAGSTTDDLLPYNTNNFLNCNTDDFL